MKGSGTFACLGFQEKAEHPRTYDQVQVDLESRFGGASVKLDMWSTDLLCSPLPTAEPPLVPSEIQMADDFQGGEVDILIGIDNLYRIVLWDQRELADGLRAMETIFGYVLHGCHGGDPDGQRPRQCFHSRQVQCMWDLDSIGIRDTELIDVQAYPQPTWSEKEKRYEMPLIWSYDERPVSNCSATWARTCRMSERLTPDKAEKYDEQIRAMLNESIVEHCELEHQSVQTSAAPVHGCADSQKRVFNEFFLPHHGIIRRDRLRIVFDGSAADGVGRNLNDYLEAGDNLLAKLPSVVLNFRSGKVGCQADIKAAFHQVSVSVEDRQYLQFFWRGTRLRFARAPFGLACSPFMLLKTVNVHLSKFADSDGQLCSLLQAGSCMDDLCLPFESREAAEQGVTRTQDIFSEASMALHKVRVTGDDTPEAPVLGLTWDTKSDQLAVQVPEFSCPSTKRELLSAVAKTFDPLGLLTPWLIWGKILFQRAWRDASSGQWDDPLDAGLHAEVQAWWER